jgi:hypothetical protein
VRPNITEDTVRELTQRADAIAGFDASEMSLENRIKTVMQELDEMKRDARSRKAAGKWYK